MRAELEVLFYLIVFCLVSSDYHILLSLVPEQSSEMNCLADKLVILRQDAVLEERLHLSAERRICKKTASPMAGIRLYAKLLGELLLSFHRTTGYVVQFFVWNELVCLVLAQQLRAKRAQDEVAVGRESLNSRECLRILAHRALTQNLTCGQEIHVVAFHQVTGNAKHCRVAVYARVEILSTSLGRRARHSELLLVERNEHNRNSELLGHKAGLFRWASEEVRDEVERYDVNTCILQHLHCQGGI